MAFKFRPADYTAEYDDGVLSFKLRGEIDHHSAKPIRERIDRELFYYRAATVILDMSEVSFMDSAGLGLILGRYTKTVELGGLLRLRNPTPDIIRLLELAGCTAIIPVDYTANRSGAGADGAEPEKTGRREATRRRSGRLGEGRGAL